MHVGIVNYLRWIRKIQMTRIDRFSMTRETEHHPFGQPIYSYRHLSTDVGAIDFIFEKSSGCIFAKEFRAGCIIIFKTDA